MDNYTNAETYLRGAVDFEPDNLLAWCILMLYYDMESRDYERSVQILLHAKLYGTHKVCVVKFVSFIPALDLHRDVDS